MNTPEDKEQRVQCRETRTYTGERCKREAKIHGLCVQHAKILARETRLMRGGISQ